MFETWMQQVDELVQRAVGLSVHDLADAPWRDYFESELTPSQALEVAIADEYVDAELAEFLA